MPDAREGTADGDAPQRGRREREAAAHREILRLALADAADAAARAPHDHIASFVSRAFPETAETEGDPA